MKPKQRDTDFWSKRFGRRQLLKTLAVAGRSWLSKVREGWLRQRGIAPLAMKSLSGNAEPIKQGLVTVEEALRYVRCECKT